MSILNVNNINPVGSGRTITVNNDVDGAAVVDITGSLNVAAGNDGGYFNVISNKLYLNNDNVTLPTLGSRDTAVFARNTNSTIVIATDSGFKSAIRFADENSNNIGQIQYDHSVDDMQFNVNGSERMRILSTGGITFNGDTATTNALDDYEEGTFTPAITGGITSPSISNVYGYYIKIGTLVMCSIDFRMNGTQTGNSNRFEVGNFPFNSSSETSIYGSATISFNNILTGFTELRAGHFNNGSDVQFYNGTSLINGNTSGVNFSNGNRLIMQVVYKST